MIAGVKFGGTGQSSYGLAGQVPTSQGAGLPFLMATPPGGFAVASSQTASFTASLATVYPCDSSGGAFNATIPTAIGNSSKQIILVKTDVSSNAVSLLTTSGQTLSGRASNSVKLREMGDYCSLISDGTNWIITSKQETQYFTAIGDLDFATIGSAGNYGQLATSITLDHGIFELDAQMLISMGSGTAPALISGSGLFSADGANSASTPAALSGVISGATDWSDLSSAVSLQFTGANSRMPSSNLKVVISQTSSQTVYLVPQIDYSSTGTTRVYCLLKAKRIW